MSPLYECPLSEVYCNNMLYNLGDYAVRMGVMSEIGTEITPNEISA